MEQSLTESSASLVGSARPGDSWHSFLCVLWHNTHVYVVVERNPLTLVSGLSAPISVHSVPPTTENLPKIKSLLFSDYHKLYFCLLVIFTWFSYHSVHSIHKLYICLLLIIHLIFFIILDILDILLTSFISACF